MNQIKNSSQHFFAHNLRIKILRITDICCWNEWYFVRWNTICYLLYDNVNVISLFILPSNTKRERTMQKVIDCDYILLALNFWVFEYFFLPESFNTNNSHQLFDYIQNNLLWNNCSTKTQIQKVILYSNTGFKRSF